jgi:hypothetical protein
VNHVVAARGYYARLPFAELIFHSSVSHILPTNRLGWRVGQSPPNNYERSRPRAGVFVYQRKTDYYEKVFVEFLVNASDIYAKTMISSSFMLHQRYAYCRDLATEYLHKTRIYGEEQWTKPISKRESKKSPPSS